MKVLLLNIDDHYGGAARAAYRLHQGLRSIGVASTLLVQSKATGDYSVVTLSSIANDRTKLSLRLASALDKRPLRLYRYFHDQQYWSLNWVPTGISQVIKKLDPQIVHLHWIGSGFMPIRALAELDRPIVWTLHDSWAFTGGCHLPHDCLRYRESCGQCPQLRSRCQQDISHWTWKSKHKHWRDLDLTIVTPSHWLADCARLSSLFRGRRIEVIPNGVNLDVFRPIDKQIARELLGLNPNKKLILFGAVNSASDYNKGLPVLLTTLRNLAAEGWGNRIEAIALGAIEPDAAEGLDIKLHQTGYIRDDLSLALIYSAADAVVTASRSENLPNVIMEAAACGTPSIAFLVGGIPDLVEMGQTGYLAQPYEADDLAKGIVWTLENDKRWQILSQNNRRKAETAFEVTDIARRYQTLYEQVF